MVINGNRSTAISRQRIESACKIVQKNGWVPHDMFSKARFIRTAAHTKALYASESSHFDEHGMARYTTLIAKVLSPSTYNHSNAIVYTQACVGPDLDPSVNIFVRRILMMRRMVVKHPHCLQQLKKYHASLQC